MALINTLDYFLEKHEGRARLIKYLQSVAVAARDPKCKGWFNIIELELETRSGNYIESSMCAMFVYG